eukprot:CAMPEP_0170143852 /NCGR_PEP_ID=MMETSP0033_2-20121228/13172_1 /TAXON_ID=195969 /ORGANISM="Dolichomastix tenuilepis, Strain CCMP3274" /LENGTH=323 /DNA_ID=CAMNT_0010380323 /DNA_START=304 /DNA_END=1275 /DNA_ORIENTATION=-
MTVSFMLSHSHLWGGERDTITRGCVPEFGDNLVEQMVDSEPPFRVEAKCKAIMLKVLQPQRGGWGDFSERALAENSALIFLQSLKPFLPDHRALVGPRRIMDIGCGMALYDLWLMRHFAADDPPDLYLVDREVDPMTDFTSVRVGGWHGSAHVEGETSIGFYTSIKCAKNTLVENGVDPARIQTVFASKESLAALAVAEPGSFDMIFSMLSYGHHYTVQVYLDEVTKLLRLGGILLLDLRGEYKRTTNAQGEIETRLSAIFGLNELHAAGFECDVVRHRRRGKTVKCIKLGYVAGSPHIRNQLQESSRIYGNAEWGAHSGGGT